MIKTVHAVFPFRLGELELDLVSSPASQIIERNEVRVNN